MTIKEQLNRPFPSKEIKTRVGGVFGNGNGQLFVFVDARTVQDRLDEVFGLDGWSVTYDVVPNVGVVCKITATIEGKEVMKSDGAGFRSAPNTQADKNDLKSAISDAFKRAAVGFGIGRYLYEIGNIFVRLDNRQFKGSITLPDQFLPEDERTGNTELKIQYSNPAPQTYAPKTESTSESTMDINDAMNFIVETGFSVGKKMSDISEKSLGWLSGNGATDSEKQAARAVLKYKQGGAQ